MEIKNYEALINENQASLGLVIDKEAYDISFFNDSDLFYEVLHKDNIIKVYSSNHEILFKNITHEIQYFAHKTESLIILVGVISPEPKFTMMFEAIKA